LRQSVLKSVTRLRVVLANIDKVSNSGFGHEPQGSIAFPGTTILVVLDAGGTRLAATAPEQPGAACLASPEEGEKHFGTQGAPNLGCIFNVF
jgi:hypothetical protein